MDNLADKVDSGTMGILRAHKINDSSLLLLEDKDLQEMGITQKGPRMIILKSISDTKQDKQTESSDSSDSESVHEDEPQTPSKLRSTLMSDSKFRINVLLPILDRNEVPDINGLHHLTRLACKDVENRIRSQGQQGYPTTGEQRQIALDILKTFPHLSKTRVTQDAPDESRFFYENNGKSSGKHSGYVYHRIRNIIKDIPDDQHKYQRPRSMESENESSTSRAEILEQAQERAELLKAKEPHSSAARFICEQMAACHELHLKMLRDKKGLDNILETFPHFRSYDGLVIHQAFLRHFPHCAQECKLKFVLSKCLFYVKHRYTEVKNAYIKGCLRLIAKIPSRGTGRSADATQDEIDLQMARPLIRWVPVIGNEKETLDNYLKTDETSNSDPHILCLAQPMENGSYVLIFGGKSIVKLKSAIHAIDSFFKCFTIFGVDVPTPLRMWYDFVACTVYKTIALSDRSTVNDEVAAFREVIQAEEATEDGEAQGSNEGGAGPSNVA